MLFKIVWLITFLLHTFIVGQSLFYILAMSNVTRKLKLESFIEVRQLIDNELRFSLYLVYYLALGFTIATVTISFMYDHYAGFTYSAIALAALIADIVLSLKGNIPINKEIRTWTPDHFPPHWKEVRGKWLRLLHIRQVVNIAGFLGLLCVVLFP